MVSLRINYAMFKKIQMICVIIAFMVLSYTVHDLIKQYEYILDIAPLYIVFCIISMAYFITISVLINDLFNTLIHIDVREMINLW